MKKKASVYILQVVLITFLIVGISAAMYLYFTSFAPCLAQQEICNNAKGLYCYIYKETGEDPGFPPSDFPPDLKTCVMYGITPKEIECAAPGLTYCV